MLRFTILLTVLILGRIVHGQSEVEGKVIKVSEGDMIEILTNTHDTLSIKLSNIDCPESGQEYFEEARRFCEKMCLNKKVTFISTGKDAEGTELGRVVLSNKKVLNVELVDAGFAWHYRKGLQFTVDTEALVEKEKTAQTSRKGLWSSENPQAPWIFKRNLTRYEAKSSY